MSDGGSGIACGRYTHKYIHICTDNIKNVNNSRNISAMRLPPGPLSSYTRGPTPIARDAGCERSYSRNVRSCPCTPADLPNSLQGNCRDKRHHDAASDHRGFYVDLLLWVNGPEEVPLGSERCRERHSLWQGHT
jgi:hypothetical protein